MKVNPMFKSKRFVAFAISMFVFVVIYITDMFVSQMTIEPISLATGLTMIAGIYIAGESLRASVKNDQKQ